MRILVVEDEILIAEYLKDILHSMHYEDVHLARNKEQALAAIESFRPELVLLDIRMAQELDGISIATEINETSATPFIFITAHADQDIVQQALKTKPAAYITKPFKKIDVYAAISIVVKQMEEHARRKLTFKDGYATIKLPSDEVLYIEAQGNYVVIVTQEKRYTIRRSLEWCMEHLPKENFAQTHRSFLVNLDKIEKRTVDTVYVNGDAIPVAKRKRLEFRKI